MTDLSSLSDEQLKALYAKPAAAAPSADLSKLSDDDLKALHASLPEKESLGSDLAKSAASGLANAAAGTFGMPGDARALLSAATDKAGEKLGVAPETVQSLKDTVAKVAGVVPGIGALVNAPTSRDIINSAPDAIVSPDYKPQTMAGGYAKTGAEFLPSAFLGGGEGLLARLGTRVLAPAVADETMGQLTSGTAAEPYARVGGALLGGASASKLASTLMKAAPVATSADELKTAAKATFNSPAIKAIDIPSQDVASLGAKIENDLVQQGYRPTLGNAPGTFAEVKNLTPPPGVQSVKVDDLRSARRALNIAAGQRDPLTGAPTADALAATKAIGHIDGFVDTLAPDLKTANANYAAANASDRLDYRQAKAERRAAKSGTGGNLENVMRQEADKIQDRGLTPIERAARDQIVLGTTARNALRTAGKLGVDGGLSLMLHIGAALGSGGATVPLTVAGTAARKVGELLTRSEIAKLGQTIRERAPLHQAKLAAAPAPISGPTIRPLASGLASALLAAKGAAPERIYVSPSRPDDARRVPAVQ